MQYFDPTGLDAVALVAKGAPMGNQNAKGPHGGGGEGKGASYHLKAAMAHRNAVKMHDMGAHEFRGQDAGALHATARDAHVAAVYAHEHAISNPSDENSARAEAATGAAKAPTFAAFDSTPAYQPKGYAENRAKLMKSEFASVLKGAPPGNQNAAGPHKGGNAMAKGSGYFPSHSAAMAAAHDHIKSKGLNISDENWFRHVSGVRKPGEGKTNEYHIPLHQGENETDKYAHVQVYNRGTQGSHPYELNAYVDSGKPKIVKADFAAILKGDLPGHEFHGNQYSDGAMGKYVEGLKAKNEEYAKAMGGSDAFRKTYEVSHGSKYAKVIETSSAGRGQKSVHSFVDKTTGNVHKPAGWNAPAKHARGNISSSTNGMEAIDHAGFVHYLR